MRIKLLVLLCLAFPLVATAQHILEDLDIQVLLKDNGNARVTESRHAIMDDSGTEGFIKFHNMGDIEVRDLQVTDEKGVKYVVEQEWDTDRSRAEKKNLCGYLKTSKGVEVCWGIGDSGDRTYVISYTLTNLVKGYQDYDGFNHSFYEAENTPANQARVEIRQEGDSLNRTYAGVWTFGHHGTKGFSDGVCYAVSDGLVGTQESIIILLQLKKGHFHPSVVKDASFTETVKRKAFEGSSYNLEDAGLGQTASRFVGDSYSGRVESESHSSFWNFFNLETLATGIGVIIVMIYVWFSMKKDEKKKALQRQQRKENLVRLMGGQPLMDVPYYRDLPIGGNLILSGEMLESLNTMAIRCDGDRVNVRFRLQQLYDAFILRMIYKQQIQLSYDKDEAGNTRKLFRIERPVKPQPGEDLTPVLTDSSMRGTELGSNNIAGNQLEEESKRMYVGYINDAGIEYYLQKILYEAAGDDHLLQPDELNSYVDANPLTWRSFAFVLNMLTEKCVGEDKLTKEDVLQVVGFLRYLRDFSLVAERGIEETSLWKEYLVYASLYGIADQVRKDMKKVAPDVAQLEQFKLTEEIANDFVPLRTSLAESLALAFRYATTEERVEYDRKLAEIKDTSDYGGSGSSSYGGGGGCSSGGGSGFR